MGHRLADATQWLTPLLYPAMPEAGHRYMRAFASWVYEFSDPYRKGQPGTVAEGVHEIHATRFYCTLDNRTLGRIWPGYWEPASARHPNGRVRDDLFERGARAARAHGAARVRYRKGQRVPTHVFVPPVQAALARAVAMRDLTAHLDGFFTANRELVVAVDGVGLKAERLDDGTWVRTQDEAAHTDAAAAAQAILRKVNLEYVGNIALDDLRPTWLPTGFEAARALYRVGEELTGAPVPVGTAPEVRFENARLVLTPALTALLPELHDMYGDDLGADGGDVIDTADVVMDLPVEAPPAPVADAPATKPVVGKRKKAAAGALVFGAHELSMLRGQRGVA